MAETTATDRAMMPNRNNAILDRRTVEYGNANLLKWLKPGMSVLDVGCGTGAITRGIAERVGPTGHVLGIDSSDHLIDQARQNHQQSNLQFAIADINTFDDGDQFDLVTSARVLQWLPNPAEVLGHMKRLLKPGGILAILDYNHEKISWSPEPPASMQTFYNAFLTWRRDAGFDNAIADHLQPMMEKLGITDVQIESQAEISQRADADFQTRARIWSEVAEIRGPQLVRDGYITEADRLQAITDYDNWVQHTGQSMQLYLLAVEGKVS
jgi:ubiquinone/menaquinone biosynthesis C-methylase UbiE